VALPAPVRFRDRGIEKWFVSVHYVVLYSAVQAAGSPIANAQMYRSTLIRHEARLSKYCIY